jgi:CRP-like cAMP-binding protein
MTFWMSDDLFKDAGRSPAMLSANDSSWFGKALLAMLDDQRNTAVSELFISSIRSHKRNEPILSSGEPGKEMFVICRGRVQLYYENNLGEKVVVKEMGAGEQFGEIALIDGESQPFAATALDDTEVLVLSRGDLEELLSRYPHLSIGLLTENCKWLRRIAKQLREQSSDPVGDELHKNRSLAAYLVDRFAGVAGSPTAILIFSVVICGWMYLGQFGLQGLFAFAPFDPYPFTALHFVLAIIAAVQAPIILMVLNRLAERERLKSDIDIEADARLEIELNRLQSRVDRNYEEFRKQLAKIESARGIDPASRLLARADPARPVGDSLNH